MAMLLSTSSPSDGAAGPESRKCMGLPTRSFIIDCFLALKLVTTSVLFTGYLISKFRADASHTLSSRPLDPPNITVSLGFSSP